uniref:Uncharacterized protein n=1 Tax=Populus trichocarpa TaxID=3694 RepID=A0A3N7FGY2_POPTR
MEKGELRWLLVKEGLPLAGEGRGRCWNRLEREKPSSWPARRREKSDEEGGLVCGWKRGEDRAEEEKKTENPPGGRRLLPKMEKRVMVLGFFLFRVFLYFFPDVVKIAPPT